MMDLYKYLIKEYGYDEPIFSSELLQEINEIKPSTLRQTLKRLTESGKIKRYKEGIYFLPEPNSKSKYKTLNTEKVITKKYLYNRKNERVGYVTGLSFANALKLTTQNPAKIELVTNSEKATVRAVDLNNQKVIVRKPRVMVNNNNFKILQILDLLTNFEKLSVIPIRDATSNILEYLKDVNITKEQLNFYLSNYPDKTYRKIVESNLYDVLTKKGAEIQTNGITQR